MSPSVSVDVYCVTDEKYILDQYSDVFIGKYILDQYSDVFTGLGCAKGEYTIQLDESIAFFQN